MSLNRLFSIAECKERFTTDKMNKLSVGQIKEEYINRYSEFVPPEKIQSFLDEAKVIDQKNEENKGIHKLNLEGELAYYQECMKTFFEDPIPKDDYFARMDFEESLRHYEQKVENYQAQINDESQLRQEDEREAVEAYIALIIKYADVNLYAFNEAMFYIEDSQINMFLSMIGFHIIYKHRFFTSAEVDAINEEYNSNLIKINMVKPPKCNLFISKKRLKYEDEYINMSPGSIISLLSKHIKKQSYAMAKIIEVFCKETHIEEINNWGETYYRINPEATYERVSAKVNEAIEKMFY